MAKHVAPSVTLKSFSCPVCGAHADQTWYEVFAEPVRYENRLPFLPTQELADDLRLEAKSTKDPEEAENFRKLADRFAKASSGVPNLFNLARNKLCGFEADCIQISECYSCGDITIWRHDTILYPPARYEIEPNEDMAEDIKADFEEARKLLNLSPRAAAALLRLCIQKLCKQAGEPGENISQDISSLVKKGLKPQIAKALHVVRVIGNNAVHPGSIDLKDDRDTAAKLFELVNRIAYDMITHPKEVQALYEEKIPESTQAAIAKRDGNA